MPPSRVVTNAELSQLVDTSDEWIRTRTGIEARQFCQGETQVGLAAQAARPPWSGGGLPRDLCACVATVTPTAPPPPRLPLQQQLDLPEDIPCFDMNVGCTGFLYALQVARGFLLQSGGPTPWWWGRGPQPHHRPQDRGTCVLFGDGAGAVVVRWRRAPLRPPWAPGATPRIFIRGPAGAAYIRMDGQRVFRFAVERCPVHPRLLEETGLSLEDIDWFVPTRPTSGSSTMWPKAGVPAGSLSGHEHYGNTSAASIPIALDEMVEKACWSGAAGGMVGFGAGLTWGGALLEW